MARHRQPLEQAEIKGATRHDPQRYRKESVKNALPLGPPPTHLSPESLVIWKELECLAPAGVLTASERLMMEVLSNLIAEYRGNPPDFSVGKYTHLIGLLARMGMTPADRQKIGVTKTEISDPMDEFLQ